MSSSSRFLGYALAIATAFLLIAPSVFAQTSFETPEDEDTTYQTITADDLLNVTDADGVPVGTIGEIAGLGTQNLQTTVAQIIRAILTFLGVVAVVIILWGGFKWMTSGGADDKVKDARKLIVMGIVGLAIVLSSYAIASFVITSLVSATT